MPKSGQDDHSRGDRRQPYSDAGGPQGRHAATHDVRREAATQPGGIRTDPEDASFERDLRGGSPPEQPEVAADRKDIYDLLPDFNRADLQQLLILPEGTQLEQGATYLDLKNRRVFRPEGSQSVEKGMLVVAKKNIDYEMWDRLTERS